MKLCRICREAKPLDEYYRAAGARDGYRTECKACNRAMSARRYRENPEPAIERATKWNRDNAQRYNERMREYRESGKKKVSDRKSYLKRKYGLTLEHYDAMLAAQGGVCAICRKPPRGDYVLHVDHDHGDGRIRGLLHFTCNNLLGDAEDNPTVLREAADYLEGVDTEEVRREVALARARVRDLVASR